MSQPTTSHSELTFLERADRYQTLNCRVFPVTPGGKTPVRGCRWASEATTEWPRLTEWSERYPTANVGVVTGEVVDVIDCDSHRAAVVFAQQECAYSGEDIEGALAAIIAIFGNVVVTPRGVHIYVIPTEGARGTTKAQLRQPEYASQLGDDDGIDYRGAGNYVVGAGSVRDDGTAYVWYGDRVLRPAPAWLTRSLADERPATPALPLEPPASKTRQRRAFEAALDGECSDLRLATKGSRHDRTLRAALKIGGLLYEPEWRDEARAALVDAARATGYPRSEAEQTVDDGLDHASQHLRPLRDRPAPTAAFSTPSPEAEVHAEAAEEKPSEIAAATQPWERIAEDADRAFDPSDLLELARYYVSCGFFGPPGSWVIYSADGNWYRRDSDCVWRVTSADGNGDRTLYDQVYRGLEAIRAIKGPFPRTPEIVQRLIRTLPTAAVDGGHCVPAPPETHYWTTDDHPAGDWFLVPGGELFSPARLEFIPCPGNYWAESLELTVRPEPGPTPIWDSAFVDVGLDGAAMRRLNQICAILCFGKNSRIEKIPILFGPGGCGKTVILQLLCALLGECAASVSPDELAQQFNSSTATKRVIVLDDRDRSAARVAELMLSHGGGIKRRVTLQLKHKEPVNKLVAQRWIFGCNELPAIRDVGGRHQRRWWVLPFERSAPQANIHLLDQLLGEAPQLLWRWAAEYATLQVPEQIVPLPYDAELARAIRCNSNPLAQWISDRLVTASDCFVGTQALLHDYQAWAKSTGVDTTVRVTLQTIRTAVTEWAQVQDEEPRALDATTNTYDRPHYTRCGNVRGWWGIGLRPRAGENEPDGLVANLSTDR